MKKRGRIGEVYSRVQPFITTGLLIAAILTIALFSVVSGILGYTDLAIKVSGIFFVMFVLYCIIIVIVMVFLTSLVTAYGSKDAAHYMLFIPVLLGMAAVVSKIQDPTYPESIPYGFAIFALSLILVLINYYFLESLFTEKKKTKKAKKRKKKHAKK